LCDAINPDAECHDGAHREAAERGQRHRRPAERPEDVQDRHPVVDVELQKRAQHGQLEEHEPQSAGEQEA
jgi:hypothetical protein